MIALTGSSGFLGQALQARWRAAGRPVRRLVRRGPSAGEAQWDPAAGRLEGGALEGVTAVVNLAGENLTTGRWTPARRRRLVSSRVGSTRLLAETMARLPHPPAVLVSASAIGIYGARGEEVLTEASVRGTGFLADLVADWEAAAAPAVAAGIRVVHLRFGLILGHGGGMLGRLVPLFRWGLGGALGHGQQWMSWVSLRDTLSIVDAALTHPEWHGPLNVTAPSPVRNEEFTGELAARLNRPAFLRVPASLLELLLGDLAREAILASARVLPARLQDLGFMFQDRELSLALPLVLEPA